MSCPLRIPYITAWELKLRSCMPFVPLAEKNEQIKRILNAERIQHWNFLPLSLVVFQCFEPIISAVLYNYNWYITCSILTRNESMMNMHVLFATAVCCEWLPHESKAVCLLWCFNQLQHRSSGMPWGLWMLFGTIIAVVWLCNMSMFPFSRYVFRNLPFPACTCAAKNIQYVIFISCVGWCLYIFFVVLLHAEGVTTSTILRMETGLLYTRVDTGSSLLCFYRETNRLKPGMCDSANLSSWVPCFWWWNMTNHGNFLSSMTHIIRMI